MIGGIYSTICTYPLDLIKTRMQVPGTAYTGTIDAFRQILTAEGFLGLYNGLGGEVFKTSVQKFIWYYLYSAIKSTTLAKISEKKKDTTQPAAASASATTTAAAAPATEVTPVEPPPVPLNPNASAAEPPVTQEKKLDDHPDLYIKAEDSTGVLGDLLVGIAAGCLCQVVVNPLNLVHTRLQTRSSSDPKAHLGMWGTFLDVLGSEGWRSLYRGFESSLVLTTNPAISQLVYERLDAMLCAWIGSDPVEVEVGGGEEEGEGGGQEKQEKQKKVMLKLRRRRTPVEYLVMGGLAKLVATIITYPYIMAKIRLQCKLPEGSKPYRGAVDVIIRTFREEGFLGLFTGLQAQLIKSVLLSALMYMAKGMSMEYAKKIVSAGHHVLELLGLSNKKH